MKQSSYLIKPASSLCNMNCLYCFYSDVSKHRETYSKGIMKKETVDILIKKALNDSDDITFAFQGGEPTVAGIDFFKYFITSVDSLKTNQVIHYAIQTNGYAIDEEWISIFKKNNFLVGISLDGYKDIHNEVRLKGNKETFNIILSNIKKIQESGIDYNILTVVTSKMVKHAKEIYGFYKEQGFKYIQFIPCLPELDHYTDEYYLKPKEFYKFYKDIFILWLEDLKHGYYVSISLFEDLLMIFQGKYPRTCGMLGSCQLQMIIEADGSVYPCDFYAIDENKLGDINKNSLEDIRQSPKGLSFLKQEKRHCQSCEKCQFKNICHGQCKRMNVVYFDDNYCGYQQFLKETYQIFYNIGQGII